jgi:hypothetical protein
VNAATDQEVPNAQDIILASRSALPAASTQSSVESAEAGAMQHTLEMTKHSAGSFSKTMQTLLAPTIALPIPEVSIPTNTPVGSTDISSTHPVSAEPQKHSETSEGSFDVNYAKYLHEKYGPGSRLSSASGSPRGYRVFAITRTTDQRCTISRPNIWLYICTTYA